MKKSLKSSERNRKMRVCSVWQEIATPGFKLH